MEGLPLLGAQRELPQLPVRGDLPGLLGPLGEAIHRPAEALVAAAIQATQAQMGGRMTPQVRDREIALQKDGEVTLRSPIIACVSEFFLDNHARGA